MSPSDHRLQTTLDAIRILSLNQRLIDPRVTNAGYQSSTTSLEFDIVVWNAESILLGRNRYAQKYRGDPSINEADSATLERYAKQRQKEFASQLASGRVLVILVPKPITFYEPTGEKRNDGTAAKPRIATIVRQRRVEEFIPVDLVLEAAHGETIDSVSHGAFGQFWREVGDEFFYDSYFTSEGTTVATIASTEHAVAAVIPSGEGLVILLPQRHEYGPSDDFLQTIEDSENYEELVEKEQSRIDRQLDSVFVDSLITLCNELRQKPLDSLPEWTESLVIPGEAEARTKLDRAMNRLETATRSVGRFDKKLKELQEVKRLVTATGAELEGAVREALVKLGCSVISENSGRSDLKVQFNEQSAVVEIKGLTKSAREKDSAQLEKWVAEDSIESGSTSKGILIVNAWREAPLENRTKDAFPDQMLKYATARDHSLVRTDQLLAALVSDPRCHTEFLVQVFGSVGVLQNWNWREILEDNRSSA